jgi:hypothetical protein
MMDPLGRDPGLSPVLTLRSLLSDYDKFMTDVINGKDERENCVQNNTFSPLPALVNTPLSANLEVCSSCGGDAERR